MAINSWLMGETPRSVTSLINTSYITEKQASVIPERVSFLLGEKDEAKVWLAACLLKTVKSNQRWHKRTELMDDYPEATSWFKKQA